MKAITAAAVMVMLGGAASAQTLDDLKNDGKNPDNDRFVRSVSNGKNQMPAWGDMLRGDDIEALWAYVTMGEKK